MRTAADLDPAASVAALYAAYNAADPAAAAALYSPRGRHVEIATGAERTGREAIEQGLRVFLTAFPDAAWRERRRLTDGRLGAVAYELTGTLRAQLGPFAPDGQRLELRGVHLLTVGVDGIESLEDYWDAATFGRQMSGG